MLDYTQGRPVPLPITQGGTGSITQNFVDLTNAQTVGGIKTLTSAPVPLTNKATDIGTSSLRFGTVWSGTLQANNSTGIQLADASNLVLGTTTGTKIGTAGGAAGQKIGFFNQTPIVQPLLATGAGATVDNVITALQNLGLVRQS